MHTHIRAHVGDSRISTKESSPRLCCETIRGIRSTNDDDDDEEEEEEEEEEEKRGNRRKEESSH